MSRFLVLACLLLAGVLSAQRPMARVVLQNGTIVTGTVLRDTEEIMVLQIGSQDHIIEMNQVKDLELLEPGAAEPGIQTPQERRPAPRPQTPPRPGLESTPEPQQSSGPAQVVDQFFDSDGAHIFWFDRYIWFVPTSTNGRISLVIGFWMLLGLLIHLSTKVAGGLETVSFLRAQLMAFVLLVAGAIQLLVAFPFEGLRAAVFIGLDVMLWLLLTQLIYQSGIGRGLAILVGMALFSLVTVLGLELVLYLLQQAVAPGQ